MTRKRYTAEDIIGHRRTIEIETGKGLAVLEACRKLGITGAKPLIGGSKKTAACGSIRRNGSRVWNKRMPGSNASSPISPWTIAF